MQFWRLISSVIMAKRRPRSQAREPCEDSETSLFKALMAAKNGERTATMLVLARRILEHNPLNALAWFWLGTALGNLANFEEAQRALKRALELSEQPRH